MAEQATVGLKELVSRFTEDPSWIPSVSDELADAIAAEIPDAAGDLDFRRSLDESVEANIRQLAEMIRAGMNPAEAQNPPAAVEYARQFVRRGMSIDSLLRAYFVGHATFVRRWVAQLHDEVDDPAELSAAVEQGALWTFTYIQALTRGMVERYGEESERWVRSAAAVRSEGVRRLLAGGDVDLSATALQLRYELDRRHLAFVVWNRNQAGDDPAGGNLATLERAGAELGAALGSVRPLLVPLGTGTIAGWLGSHEPFAEALFEGLRLQAETLPDVCAALGAPGEGVPGFRRTHRQALHARRVAQLTDRPAGSVTAYRDVALSALASADIGHAREFVTGQLGPLADGDDDHLLRLSATLLVFLEENSSPRHTAQRLGVHENTVANRIRAAQLLLVRPIEESVPELLVALRLAPLVRSRPTAMQSSG